MQRGGGGHETGQRPLGTSLPRVVAADGQVRWVEQCRADQEAERDLQVEEAAVDQVLSKGLGPDFADP
jgi:uncharacterized tellurite resistance protein B-like protein